MAHNSFGFEFYFILRGIRVPVWKTKKVNIGGSNLTDINFANFGNQVKLINIMKYQQSLLNLSATTTNKEETAIKNQLCNFFYQQD